jgi:hypothetical protein
VESSSDFLLYFEEVYEKEFQNKISLLNSSLDQIFLDIKNINSSYQDFYHLISSLDQQNLENIFTDFSLFLSRLENLLLDFNSFFIDFKSSTSPV